MKTKYKIEKILLFVVNLDAVQLRFAHEWYTLYELYECFVNGGKGKPETYPFK